MEFTGKPSCRIYSWVDPFYSVTIKDANVKLAPFNPTDDLQIWYKIAAPVNDQDGAPTFALVNKRTGEAMKSSGVQNEPVTLVPFKSQLNDLSILWSESSDSENGYKSIRTSGNTNLYFDASLQGEPSVGDGTKIVLWTRNFQKNQWWKIENSGTLTPGLQTFRVSTKHYPDYSLSEVDGEVIMARADKNDNRQHWYRVDQYGSEINGNPGFTLINEVTGDTFGYDAPYQSSIVRVPYNPNVNNTTTIWTTVEKASDGYAKIRPLNNIANKWLNAHNVPVNNGWMIIANEKNAGDFQKWGIAPY